METANFFRQIAQMDINSKLTLSITKATENRILVSILIENDGCADKAKNVIPPFNLKGSPEELDFGFFEHIKKPVQMADGLISNMQNFLKGLETAQANSAMEKQKSDKEKAKGRKYSEALLKADALAKVGKYKDAWTALPKVGDYPEHKEDIRKKQDEYEKQFVPDLWSASEQKAEQEQEQEKVDQEEYNP
ncbi:MULTISPECIES: PRTRC system protein E [Chryseobacterium]|uniref:PRTRC system protein E n=2 Tax=Chryseobacterium gleum TaxID=250 RepID=A0A448B9I9_CHRGE|nr:MULTISPECIES: PRTRC system protein E [Chryseobacterium]HAF35325.1 PRTRC system protein E [Sphingobacterium sp.]EFK36056.1 PRTRC system protein E [Chryseobacterium gleum ATCC 35910]QQY31758.1 PRTRC system protein E [Chryseobacterium gleum]VEE11217.1 PRTRC system protein E [Chryseobacterium gleum]VFA44018.1 PRTRC system protein E [Chryseobacterium indologenes]